MDNWYSPVTKYKTHPQLRVYAMAGGWEQC